MAAAAAHLDEEVEAVGELGQAGGRRGRGGGREGGHQPLERQVGGAGPQRPEQPRGPGEGRTEVERVAGGEVLDDQPVGVQAPRVAQRLRVLTCDRHDGGRRRVVGPRARASDPHRELLAGAPGRERSYDEAEVGRGVAVNDDAGAAGHRLAEQLGGGRRQREVGEPGGRLGAGDVQHGPGRREVAAEGGDAELCGEPGDRRAGGWHRHAGPALVAGEDGLGTREPGAGELARRTTTDLDRAGATDGDRGDPGVVEQGPERAAAAQLVGEALGPQRRVHDGAHAGEHAGPVGRGERRGPSPGRRAVLASERAVAAGEVVVPALSGVHYGAARGGVGCCDERLFGQVGSRGAWGPRRGVDREVEVGQVGVDGREVVGRGARPGGRPGVRGRWFGRRGVAAQEVRADADAVAGLKQPLFTDHLAVDHRAVDGSAIDELDRAGCDEQVGVLAGHGIVGEHDVVVTVGDRRDAADPDPRTRERVPRDLGAVGVMHDDSNIFSDGHTNLTMADRSRRRKMQVQLGLTTFVAACSRGK